MGDSPTLVRSTGPCMHARLAQHKACVPRCDTATRNIRTYFRQGDTAANRRRFWETRETEEMRKRKAGVSHTQSRSRCAGVLCASSRMVDCELRLHPGLAAAANNSRFILVTVLTNAPYYDALCESPSCRHLRALRCRASLASSSNLPSRLFCGGSKAEGETQTKMNRRASVCCLSSANFYLLPVVCCTLGATGSLDPLDSGNPPRMPPSDDPCLVSNHLLLFLRLALPAADICLPIRRFQPTCPSLWRTNIRVPVYKEKTDKRRTPSPPHYSLG